VRKNIIILAAPFGFGPAAKALRIADALADLADITLFSSRDAMRFIARYRAPSVRCVEGVFHAVYPHARDLSGFDLFVSVDNEPAVHHLVSKGFASRAVFFDDIFAWRAANGPVAFAQPIRGYVVQDFPGAAQRLPAGRAQLVALTAPLQWPPLPVEPGSLGIVLHLGGVTSPLVGWEALRRPIEAIVSTVLGLAQRHGRRVTIVGSRHVESLGLAPTPALSVVGEASPAQAATLVAGAELLVTTPGIGTIYDALSSRVPLVMLPPMNSTQLLQYDVLAARGFAGTIAPREQEALVRAAATVPWDRQTAVCVEWLNRRTGEALSLLPALARALLDDGTRHDARAERLARQQAYSDSLSATDAVAVLRGLLA